MIFINYESPLGLVVSLSITIAFVNCINALKCFFIRSDLLVGHTSVFRMVVNKFSRSVRDHIRTVSGLSFDPDFHTVCVVCGVCVVCCVYGVCGVFGVCGVCGSVVCGVCGIWCVWCVVFVCGVVCVYGVCGVCV